MYFVFQPSYIRILNRKKMDGTKARQIGMEISLSFTVSHISLTAEHVSMYISVFHTIASNVKTIQRDPTDVTLKGNDRIPILWQRSGNGKCKQNMNGPLGIMSPHSMSTCSTLI